MMGEPTLVAAHTKHLSELSEIARCNADVELQAISEDFLDPSAELSRQRVANEAWAANEADSYIIAAAPIDQQEIEKLAAEIDF